MNGGDTVEEYLQDVLVFLELKALGGFTEVVIRTAQIEADGQTRLTQFHPHTFAGFLHEHTVSPDAGPNHHVNDCFVVSETM